MNNNLSEMFVEKEFSQEAKNNLNDKEYMLNYFLSVKAWKDATLRERFQGKKSNIINNKTVIVDFLKKEITENNEKICKDFDAWHNGICKNTIYGEKYGFWQKYVNMTFKYMYCRKGLFPEFDGVWAKCHCPIDSIIAEQLYNILVTMNYPKDELVLSKSISRSGSVNWNNINEEQYKKFQSQVNEFCKKEKITPLEFDFKYWAKINK